MHAGVRACASSGLEHNGSRKKVFLLLRKNTDTRRQMAHLFSEDALKVVAPLAGKDSVKNTILMDARVHKWFDDYRFGILPMQVGDKWYGKIFRFENNGCDVDGEWLLAAAHPPRPGVSRPAAGTRETSLEREAREADEKLREEDKTRYDMTADRLLREVLWMHFQTCLHWHVKGMGWAS